jgi:hypothetical protein
MVVSLPADRTGITQTGSGAVKKGDRTLRNCHGRQVAILFSFSFHDRMNAGYLKKLW